MAYGLIAIGHYYFKATIGPFNSNNFLGSIFLPRLSGTYETWPPHQEHRSFAYERKDYETAYKLILPLAEQGYAEAQYNLGIKYSKGQGVQQNFHKKS